MARAAKPREKLKPDKPSKLDVSAGPDEPAKNNKPAKTADPIFALPKNTLRAICHFAGILGRQFSRSTGGGESGGCGWVSTAKEGELCVSLCWLPGGVLKAVFQPQTEAELAIAYALIGYCAVHHIEWESL
jgi:hypothetical protein